MVRTREIWDIEKILLRLKEVVELYGRVPTNEELKHDLKYKSLQSAMDKRGGKNEFIKKLGLKVYQEKQGFWNYESTISKLRTICEKLEYFPTHKELQSNYGATLSDMVIKYGGSEKLAKQLGFPLSYKGKINGWKLLDIQNTILEIITKTGEFPNTTWLQKNGYGGMVASIYSNYGNLEKIAESLGFQTETHTQGYWTNWENVKFEVEDIMKNTISFPNYQQIKYYNRKLTKGIKEFGGINKVAKLMGFEPPKQIVAKDGHYLRSTYEYLFDNFLYGHGINHTVDGYIDEKLSNYRYDFKIGNVFVEIWGYTNSESNIAKQYKIVRELKEEFYKSNNFQLISFTPKDFIGTPKEIENSIAKKLKKSKIEFPKIREDYIVENYYNYVGYWTEDRTKDELKKEIEHYGDFPSEAQLRKDKKSSLALAMNKYGGVNHFRQLLNFEIKKQNQYYWTDEIIIDKLKIIIKKLERFPSAQDLASLQEKSLSGIIAHRGGFKKFQKQLGYLPKHKEDGFYQNNENILNECERIFLKLGHFPSANELLQLGESTLRGAIGRTGGYAYYRELINKKYNQHK